jgi:primosomal protein N' (replication factor Y) (superfamily II helicase)
VGRQLIARARAAADAPVTARLVSVAVPVPFLEPLTYLVPSHLPLPPVGARVRVPVGSRVLTGCVVDAAQETGTPEHTGLKPVERVLDEEPYLPEPVVSLCRWVADYYMAGLGDTLAMALPPGARGAAATAFRTQRVARLTAHGLSLAGACRCRGSPVRPGGCGHGLPSTRRRADGMRLTPRQQRAIEALADAPAGLPLRDLRERGVTADVVTRLAARGIVSIAAERDERDPFLHATSGPAHEPGRPLTDEQEACVAQLAALADAATFRAALLHGVTGSGKTEIYLRLADRVRRGGRQVLLLVPEIALTPSVAALFRSAFGDRVAVQHSGLSGGERHDQWHRIRRGEVDLVIGTRSAVFAPLTRLGLVVVDEEHDSSYKQDETPRYHGRDVAIVRASREGALVVLGSATPSIETFHHAVVTSTRG